MSDSIGQQKGSVSTATPDALNGKDTKALDDFWKHFRLFPVKFDDDGHTYWYFSVPISYLVLLLPFFLYDSSHLEIFYPCHEFVTKNAGTVLLSIVTLCLTVVFFNRWRRSIPNTFQKLLDKGHIRSKGREEDLEEEYLHFLQLYQSALWNKKRYFLISATIPVTLILLLLIEVRYISPASPNWLIIQWLGIILFVAPPALLWGYLLGASSWAMYNNGLCVGKITKKFNLNVEPSHPDNCGGLKLLGNFCLGMALPILVGVSFFGLYGLGGVLYPKLLNGQQAVQLSSTIGLLVFDGPLAAIAFFVPLWGIHCEMLTGKEVYEDKFAEYITKLEKGIWLSLEKGMVDQAKAAKEEMDVMQALNPNTIGYPTWPFNRRILLIYLAPQILPILSLILQILPLIKH